MDAEGLVSEPTGRARLMVALPEKHPMARYATLGWDSCPGRPTRCGPGTFPPPRMTASRGVSASGLRAADHHGSGLPRHTPSSA
jgi:hypothetical protein